MDASILTSLVHKNLEFLYEENRTDLFMNRISKEYAQTADEDQFPTMFAAIIDMNTNRMYYSSANSESPNLLRKNEILRIESPGEYIWDILMNRITKGDKLTLKKATGCFFIPTP